MKKTITTIFVVALALAAALSLSACGGNQKDDATAKQNSEAIKQAEDAKDAYEKAKKLSEELDKSYKNYIGSSTFVY